MPGGHDPGVAPRGARAQFRALEYNDFHSAPRQIPGRAEADEASAYDEDAVNWHGGSGRVLVVWVRPPGLP